MNIEVTATFRIGAGYEVTAVTPQDGRVTATHARTAATIRTEAVQAVRRALLPERTDDLSVRSLVVRCPDIGPDGLIVRVVNAAGLDADGSEMHTGLGRAEWWPAEGAWLVAQPGRGTFFVPCECLNFAPALDLEARKAFQEALTEMERSSAERRYHRGRSALAALLPEITARVATVSREHPGLPVRIGLSYVIASVIDPDDLLAMTPPGVDLLVYPRTDVAVDDIAVEVVQPAESS